MKLILNVYGHNVMMHVSFMRMSSGEEKSLPYDRIHINEFVHSELKLGSEWMEFHKILLDIYSNVVIIHIQDV